MILTADKGVAMVVMDKEDYIRKADLLNLYSYKTIPADATTRQKNKLINLLKNIKAEGCISETTYRKMYPTGTGSPTFYGLPKIHEARVLLGPIVTSRVYSPMRQQKNWPRF